MSKICFVIPTLSSGGAERVVSILSSTLAEQGKNIYLIVHRHAAIEYPISSKINVIFLDEIKCKGSGFARKCKRLFEVRRFISQNSIDYVVPFLDSCIIHTFIATRGLRCKFISTLRNNPYKRSGSERVICDLITFFADANFVQNEMQKKYFVKRVQKKTFIVMNPVNPVFLEASKEYADTVRRVVAIGRLNEQKNYPRLIEAICLVKEKYPDISLKIYGEGTLFDSIRKEISDHDAHKYISLEGRTDNVVRALQDSDLYVMSSDYEGMPNALMEAMALGMPCVSTDCPTGPAELIGNNERGILASMESPKKLADAIIEMISDSEMAKQKGLAARRYMKDTFSAERISMKFYNECTKR